MTHHLLLAPVLAASSALLVAQQSPALPSLPSEPMSYGFISATFAADGTFTMGGPGWGNLSGSWKAGNGEVEFAGAAPPACALPGKYRYRVDGKQLTLNSSATPARLDA